MKVISFEDVRNLSVSPDECYKWASEAIYLKKEAILPPKISMKPEPGVFCNVMPSIISESNANKRWTCIKVVTRYPHRIPSLDSQLLLLDADNGEFLALMDATWITAMRTGAVAAHSIIHFSRSDYDTIGIMGLGNTSRSTLEVLLSQIGDKPLKIKLLEYKGQEIDFMNRFEKHKNLAFYIEKDPVQLIKGSHVVVSGATYLPEDVCQDQYYDEGVLVVPIHTLGFTNCDLFFDKIYADDTGHVCHFKNFDKFKNFAEVSDVIHGEKPGRESDSERIITYNIGLSVQDAYFASKLYTMILNRDGNNKLVDIEMKDPKEKFWV